MPNTMARVAWPFRSSKRPSEADTRLGPAIQTRDIGITVDVQSDQMPIGSFWSRGDITLRPNESVNATLERCISLIADNMATLELVVKDTSGKPIDGHPVAELWNRYPNPVQSARVQRVMAFRRLERYGQHFSVITRGPTGLGDPTELWPIFDTVRVVLDDKTDPLRPVILGYQIGQKLIPLLASEVLWLRYSNGAAAFDSIAPAAVASFPVKSDAYARMWQMGEFRNGARPSGILRLGDVTQAQGEQIKASMKSTVMGASNAGKVVALSAAQASGAGFDRISLTPAEMSYIESRQENARETALAMGVPNDLLFGQSTYDNQRSATTNLWAQTLVPKLDMVASEIDRQMVDDLSHTCEFDVSKVEALKENENDLYARTARASLTDLMTMDEARERLTLPPLPNGKGAVTLSEYRMPFKVAAQPVANPEAGVTTPGDVSADAPDAEARAALDAALTRASLPPKVRVPDSVMLEHEAKAKTAMAALFHKHGAALVDHVAARVTDADIQTRDVPGNYQAARDALTAALNDPQFRAAIKALTESTVAGAADDAGRVIAKALGVPYTTPDGIAGYIDDQSILVSTEMDATTQTEVLALFDELAAADASEQDILDALAGYFDDRGTTRAAIFALDNVAPSISRAGVGVARASGVVSAREWTTAQDNRVDTECDELEGTVVPIDGDYPGGAEPGDVHPCCRCSEYYLTVDPAELDYAASAALLTRRRADNRTRNALRNAVVRYLTRQQRVLERRAQRKDAAYDVRYWNDEAREALEAPIANLADALGAIDNTAAVCEMLTAGVADGLNMTDLADRAVALTGQYL